MEAEPDPAPGPVLRPHPGGPSPAGPGGVRLRSAGDRGAPGGAAGMTSWLRRLAWLLGRRRFEADLGEELRIQEEMAAEQARHEGLSPEAAGLAARRRAGNRAQFAAAARDVWRPPALGDRWQG